MKEQKPQGCRVSRRTFVRGAAGAVVAEVMAAPHVLAQSKTPIRIGNINSYTGSLAYAGENNLNGMNLYFDSVNWTIAGRKIELIKEDDQFNPQIGLQKAKKLVESDKVDLIVGVQASNVALAVLNYMKQQKAFYVVSGAGTDAITWDRYPYLFRTSISSYQLCGPMAHYVYDNLGKEVVTAASDYAGGHDVITQFRGPYLAKGGKVFKEMWPPLGTHDFQPLSHRHQLDQPAGNLRFLARRATRVRFMQQYSEFGLKEKMAFTGFAAIDSQTVSAQGKAAIGVITAMTYTRHARQSREQNVRRRLSRQGTNTSRTCSPTTAMSAPQRIGEALKTTDGDTSDKDKLAEAMSKVSSMRRAGRSASTLRRTIRSRTSISRGVASGRPHLDQDSPYGTETCRTRARRSTEKPGCVAAVDASLRHAWNCFVAQLLNGLVYGMLLFLMAAGLSLIFGLMNVVSLAHGSFFMLGAFIGFSIFRSTGSFWLAFVLAPIPVVDARHPRWRWCFCVRSTAAAISIRCC